MGVVFGGLRVILSCGAKGERLGVVVSDSL